MKQTNHLRELRKSKGKLQAEVIAATGISKSSYIRYEWGRTLPDILSAIAIADVLGIVDLLEIWDRRDYDSQT